MERSFCSAKIRWFSLLVGSLTAGACIQPPTTNEGTGVAMIALAQAPPDASCLRLTAAQSGVVSVTQLVPLARGMRVLATLDHLPTGFVFIDGDAFASDCDSLASTSVPNWVSTGADVFIQDGVPAAATITMTHNVDQATIGVDFAPDCAATNATCSLGSGCCSGACQMPSGTLFGSCTATDPVCAPANVVVDTSTGNTRFRLLAASQACTQDCSVAFTCGIGNLGSNLQCPCIQTSSGGLVAACSCPRPASFMGAGTAPRCQLPDNTGPAATTDLAGTPCNATWDECVAAQPQIDQRQIVVPQGCVCLPDATNSLTWNCGELNGWFSLAPQ
jgi:hypothetical protein